MRVSLALIPLAALLSTAAARYAPPTVISQKGKQFSSDSIAVKPGETIVFKNDDELTHNVFSATPGFNFNLKAQSPGAQSETSFTQEGTVLVRCAFHPRMRLTVTVKN
jgi:plastocyanin